MQSANPPQTPGVGNVTPPKPGGVKKLKRAVFEAELAKAQLELVKLQARAASSSGSPSR
jgi:hypothetical protein